MDSEVAQVIQAVQALYDPSTPPSVQSTLQRQLQLVQSSPSAWSIVGTLISHPDSSVRFFGASTLQQAIARSWHSLDPNDPAPRTLTGPVSALKESLLHWLATSAAAAYPPHNAAPGTGTSGEKPVLRKLAAATTSLSLRLGGEWNDWLLEVIMRIATSGAAREASLEVLSTAIEEIARADFVGSQRMSYTSSLSSTIPHLVSTLSSSMSPTAQPSEINLALSSFVAYLNAGQLSHTELTTLYPCLLPHVSRSETVVAAASALEELIERASGTSEMGGGSGVTRFMNRQRTTELVRGWVDGPYVRQVTEQAIADARDGADPDDEAVAVFKLVSTLGDHLIMNFLFDPPPPAAAANAVQQSDPSSILTLVHPSVHALLSLLLALSTFPGYSSEAYAINELPTGCWMYLQELGADDGFMPGPGDGREGRPGREAEWTVYRGVFVALADGLRSRATRPREDEFFGWPKDVRNAFRVQRSTTVADTLQYAYFVLRDDLIAQLVQLAAEQVTAPSTGGKDAYEDLEATLFMLLSLGEVVPMASTLSEMDATVTPSPLQQCLATLFGPAVLGRLPTEAGMHPSLRLTALRLVGEYSSWFASHLDACLQAVTFVIGGLQEPELVPGAAKALRGLCDANRKVLMSHVPSFVQVLGGLEGRIADTELAKVLQSVASVVQALPENEIVQPLLTLASPIVDKLAAATRGAHQNQEFAREECLQQLSYLSGLTRGLADPEADVIDLDASLDETSFVRESAQRILSDPQIVELRQRLAAGIEGVAQTWPGDAEIVTALSDYIRQSTSDAVPSPVALDSLALLNLCANALKLAPSSVWLGVAAQLLARMSRDLSDVSISDADLNSLLTPMEAVLNVILTAYPDVSTMDENPDVVAAFLAFCSQITRLYPRIFSALPLHYLEAVLAFAERGLAMQEQFSLKTTIELLLSSVQQTRMASPSATTYQNVVLPRIPSILRSTLLAIGGGAPRSHLVSLSELLHACLLRVPDQARPALKTLLAEPGFPTERATEESKARFERAVSAARTGKQVRQAVTDFALVCRGLDGSAYGAATTVY